MKLIGISFQSCETPCPETLTVVEADALEADLFRLAGNPFHLVGNLPYNIATPLLKQFIAAREHILDVTIMLQKEVADRLRASAGSKDYGPLSLLIQYYATPIRGFTVPPGAFTPRPKVDSAVIRLEWKPGVPIRKTSRISSRKRSARAGRSWSTILYTLCPSRSREEIVKILENEGLSRDARAETLTVEQFLRVYNQLQ